MRLFHELVIEDFVVGTSLRASAGYWMPVLGTLDVLRFMVVVDQVSGTNPTLLIFANETPDLTDAHGNGFLTIVNNAALTVGQTNLFSASLSPGDAAGTASYGYRLWYQLSGTNPNAHVRLWVTGRGRA